MKFVGAIVFGESTTHEDRVTKIMPFDVAGEWFQTVTDFFKQAAYVGDYDGQYILINVYSYRGARGLYSLADTSKFDSDTLVQSIEIRNPYWDDTFSEASFS